MSATATTLLLPPRYSADSVALWRAAIARNWTVERAHGWKVPPHLSPDRVAVYGETFLVAAVAEQLGLFLTSPSLDWLTRIPREYVQRTLGFTTLAEARHTPDRLFWKPADEKLFPAQVYASGADLPVSGELPDETPVLFSEPVEWSREYRCFVPHRAVVTLSPYWRDGRLAQAEDGSWPASPEELALATRFAARVAADQEVPACGGWVLDIGCITGTGWAVVEANPAWASGLYGCDPDRVLDVLCAACSPSSGAD